MFTDELVPSSSSPPFAHRQPSKQSCCYPTHAFDNTTRWREGLLYHLLTLHRFQAVLLLHDTFMDPQVCLCFFSFAKILGDGVWTQKRHLFYQSL